MFQLPVEWASNLWCTYALEPRCNLQVYEPNPLWANSTYRQKPQELYIDSILQILMNAWMFQLPVAMGLKPMDT
jgi:hypothetical protein